MRRLHNMISNMLTRGVVTAVNSATKMQTVAIRLLAGEAKADVEHIEPYGLTACPLPGAETVAMFPDGDRSHGFVVVVADRRYRLQGLAAGEVAIHDDQGQKVHLTRAGIVISGGGKPLLIEDVSKVRMDTPLLEVTGDVKDNCDAPTAKTMSQMRGVFNGHTHNETSTVTAVPNQGM